MPKMPSYALAALVLSSMSLAFGDAQATTHRCAPSAGLYSTVAYVGPDEARLPDAPQANEIRLAQLKAKLSGQVPRGKTYYIQRGSQGAFEKFSAGAALPGLDCIEVNCPASFPPGTTCWRCVEQIKAPE